MPKLGLRCGQRPSQEAGGVPGEGRAGARPGRQEALRAPGSAAAEWGCGVGGVRLEAAQDWVAQSPVVWGAVGGARQGGWRGPSQAGTRLGLAWLVEQSVGRWPVSGLQFWTKTAGFTRGWASRGGGRHTGVGDTACPSSLTHCWARRWRTFLGREAGDRPFCRVALAHEKVTFKRAGLA